MNIILCLLFLIILIILILYLFYKKKKESFETNDYNKVLKDIYIMKAQIINIDGKFNSIIEKLENIETGIYGTPVVNF